MIDYGTIQTALESVIRTVYATASDPCGDDVCLYWMNSSEAANWNDSPAIAMNLRSIGGIGIDEIREGGAVPAALTPPGAESADRMDRVEGRRKFVWVVRAESDCQTPLSSSASAVLGKLRTELRSTPIRAILRLAGVALSVIDPSVDLDFESDDRMMSATSMDVTLLTTATGSDFGVQEIAVVTFINEIPDPDSTFEEPTQ